MSKLRSVGEKGHRRAYRQPRHLSFPCWKRPIDGAVLAITFCLPTPRIEPLGN